MESNFNFSDDFKVGVMYLLFDDQKRLEFSSENIRAFAKELLDSPERVPDNVRKATDFQRCSVCPYAHEEGYCHALYPSLTFFDIVDKHSSHEQVRAFYLDPASNCLIIKKTSLQNALQYVSILSLIHYCEFGRKYHEYFYNVNPLMNSSDIISRIYLNAFWLYDGHKHQTIEKLKEFSDSLRITIDCQVKRLRLISKNDAFVNAFVVTHILTDMLQMDPEEEVKNGFDGFKRRILE